MTTHVFNTCRSGFLRVVKESNTGHALGEVMSGISGFHSRGGHRSLMLAVHLAI